MSETNWKQVTPAECLKWQIDNPMKEAAYGMDQLGRQRYNKEAGQFEIYHRSIDTWGETSVPGCPNYTYFIPEVTE